MFKRLLALYIAGLILLCGCAMGPPKPQEIHFFAMDTFVTITAYGNGAQKAMAAAQREILRIEAIFDPENRDGELFALNKATKHADSADTLGHAMSADFERVYAYAKRVYSESGGALDPTIFPVVKVWGFIDGNGKVPNNEALSEAMGNVDFSRIISGNEQSIESDADPPDTLPTYDSTLYVPGGMELLFGAVAKGYAAFAAANVMRELGIGNALLNLGGDIQTLGLQPDGSKWKIGLQDPNQPTGIPLGILYLDDAAAVTSGDYERFFVENGVTYHHILDPKTGYPSVSGLRSVTVVTRNGAMADALSTALFVLGEEGALNFLADRRNTSPLADEIGLVLITDDGRVIVTAALHDDFEEINEDYEYIYYKEDA